MAIKYKKNGKHYYQDGKPYPFVGRIIIDKLWITAEYPKNEHASIINEFISVKKAYGDIGFKDANYTYNCLLSNNEAAYEGEVTIQCAPDHANDKVNFFRLTMNPDRADLNSVKTELDKILPGGYMGLLQKGRVNRIDVTVDIYDVHVSEIIASYPKMRVESHYGIGSKKQSKVIGSKGSYKKITIYDKTKQLHSIKKKYAATLPMNISEDNVTRLEIQLKKQKKTLKEMLTLPNPFEPLSLVAYPGYKSPDNYDPIWSLFLTVCQDNGRKAALSHFNNADKAKYSARLDAEGKTDWWKPEKVWQGLPSAIDKIFKVKGYSPLIKS